MRAFFGGPDKPEASLLNELAARVEAVPSGGEILWVSYYFRNLELADVLLRAKRRGVKVKVCLEATPRIRSANQAVIARFKSAGMGDDFRAVHHLPPTHVHAKLYIFSHPEPVALVGTFDPSCATVEDPEVIRKIGDQNKGHNYLVEISDAVIVDALRRHFCWLASSAHRPFERISREANVVPRSDRFTVFFFPRLDCWVIPRLLEARPYQSVRIAASKFSDATLLRPLTRLVRSGSSVEVVAHHTKSRVPGTLERNAKDAGIRFDRYQHPLDLPMHSKFMLLTAPGSREVIFGSMNLSHGSRWCNHEILLHSTDAKLFDAFEERWEKMRSEINHFETSDRRLDGRSSSTADNAAEGRLDSDSLQS